MNSWLEINTKNLKHNINQFRLILSPRVKIAAVVKSNAYGHGLIGVARAVEKLVDYFCVVNLDEALELRQNKIKKPILVLSYYFDRLPEATRKNIELVVYSAEQIKKLQAIGKRLNKKIKVHLKIDTGASRLGVEVGEGKKLFNLIKKQKNLILAGIFSHFAASEDDAIYTQKQLACFQKISDDLPIGAAIRHFACSAAALVEPDSRLDMIRLGIALYGLWPSPKTRKIVQKKYPQFNLKPALTWKTRVIQVKYITKDTPVGYNGTYVAQKRIKMAVLPIGYFEGYDRHLGNKGRVVIHNKICPIIGKICMNLCMVDASNVKNLKVDDKATLIGDKITADELAEKIGTINYEVVTRINPHLPRLISNI